MNLCAVVENYKIEEINECKTFKGLLKNNYKKILNNNEISLTFNDCSGNIDAFSIVLKLSLPSINFMNYEFNEDEPEVMIQRVKKDIKMFIAWFNGLSIKKIYFSID